MPKSKRFDALLHATASIVWWTNAAGEFVEEQASWEAYTGQTWEEYRGSAWVSCLHPDDRDSIVADWAKAVATDGPYFTQGRIWSAKHGAYRAFQTRGIAIRNEQGEIYEWLGALTDVQDTIDIKVLLDRTQADLASSLQALRLNEAQLREREAHLEMDAAALKRLNDASARLWRTRDLHAGLNEMLVAAIELVAGDKGNIQLLDARKGTLVIAAQQGFQQPFLDFFKEVSTDDDSACGRELRAGERIVIKDIDADEEYAPYRAAAHAAGYRAVQSTPLIGRDGKPLGILSTHFKAPHRPSEHELQLLDLYARQAVDFMERVRAEDRQTFLMRELAHRGNNMLAVIQAIAVRSVPESVQRGAFLARLQALSRAYGALVGGRIEGASLRTVVSNEVSTFSDRVRITGPDLMISSKAAQTLALLLHELSTNSVKHGAWSSQAGTVVIGWHVEAGVHDPQLRLRWQEFGGPPPRPPTRRGFGSVIITEVVKQEFGIEPQEQFGPEGYTYVLIAPLATVQSIAQAVFERDRPGASREASCA
jgi:PAS domain S-box-containing protein